MRQPRLKITRVSQAKAISVSLRRVRISEEGPLVAPVTVLLQAAGRDRCILDKSFLQSDYGCGTDRPSPVRNPCRRRDRTGASERSNIDGCGYLCRHKRDTCSRRSSAARRRVDRDPRRRDRRSCWLLVCRTCGGGCPGRWSRGSLPTGPAAVAVRLGPDGRRHRVMCRQGFGMLRALARGRQVEPPRTVWLMKRMVNPRSSLQCPLPLRQTYAV